MHNENQIRISVARYLTHQSEYFGSQAFKGNYHMLEII